MFILVCFIRYSWLNERNFTVSIYLLTICTCSSPKLNFINFLLKTYICKSCLGWSWFIKKNHLLLKQDKWIWFLFHEKSVFLRNIVFNFGFFFLWIICCFNSMRLHIDLLYLMLIFILEKLYKEIVHIFIILLKKVLHEIQINRTYWDKK